MVALWRTARARRRARPPEEVAAPGMCRPAWRRSPTAGPRRPRRCSRRCRAGSSRASDAHVTVDGRTRAMRDPRGVHGTALRDCTRWARRGCAADRLAATAERTGITRFALLAEGSGDLGGHGGERAAAGRRGTATAELTLHVGPGHTWDAARVRATPWCCRSDTSCTSAVRSGSKRRQQSRSSGDWLSNWAPYRGEAGEPLVAPRSPAGTPRRGGSSGMPDAPRSAAGARRESRHSRARAAADHVPARPAAASGCRRTLRRPPSAEPPEN